MEKIISHFYSNTPLQNIKNSDYDYYSIINSKNYQINSNVDSKVGKGNQKLIFFRFQHY